MAYDIKAGKLGVVTVFDAKVYKPKTTREALLTALKAKTASAVISDAALEASSTLFKAASASLTSLKFANLVERGPELTIQGGKRNNTLVKHGKGMRCEMQDALGTVDALIAIGGAKLIGGALTITEDFPEPLTVIGTTFVIDQDTGLEKAAKIVIYQFLPDAILSLNQDSATAATFDLNGDVLTTEILKVTGTAGKVFYSIVDIS